MCHVLCADVLLDLTGIYLISDGVKRDFGAEGLAALSQGCTKLQHLQLSGCFRVSKLALKAIGKGLTALERLSLANCPSLTEVGMGTYMHIISMAKAGLIHTHTNCTIGIVYIDICVCVCVSLFCLFLSLPYLVRTAELFGGCRGLTHVDLSECGSCVTDKALVELGQHCGMLKALLLKACDRVSVLGIRAVAKHCKALETLDLSGEEHGSSSKQPHHLFPAMHALPCLPLLVNMVSIVHQSGGATG
jgi:hypothetical protein